jgi:hypothetical protein
MCARFLATALDGSGHHHVPPPLPSVMSSMYALGRGRLDPKVCLGAVGTEPGPSSPYPGLIPTNLSPLHPPPILTGFLSDSRFSQRWLCYGKETEIMFSLLSSFWNKNFWEESIASFNSRGGALSRKPKMLERIQGHQVEPLLKTMWGYGDRQALRLSHKPTFIKKKKG